MTVCHHCCHSSGSAGWAVVRSQVGKMEVGYRVDDPRMSVAVVRVCLRNTCPQA
jgi:hypothetical protein